jgi:hypothetical protein
MDGRPGLDGRYEKHFFLNRYIFDFLFYFFRAGLPGINGQPGLPGLPGTKVNLINLHLL